MKLAKIIGRDGQEIVLSLQGGRLTASNGDNVHPHHLPYQRNDLGIAQAITDISLLWPRLEWDLVWIVDPSDYPMAYYELAYNGKGYDAN